MRVGIRCDAGTTIGVGHLIRCVALAEELRARGTRVSFLGDMGSLPWAWRQLDLRALPVRPAPAEPERLAAFGLDFVVLDSYTLPPGTGAALMAAGTRVLAVIDGDPLGQEAHLYLDQNLGAEEVPCRLPYPGVRLAGARYVLLRDSVRRAIRPPRWPGVAVPHVLCFFGGTDAAGVTPRWVEALRATGVPFTATVISSAPLEAGEGITVMPPTDLLPNLMAAADLVVTAAGSAVWELLYLGVPAALTWVADNQLIGYEALVGRGLAAGLGGSAELAVPALRRLLTDPGLRAEYGTRGRELVDGRGRERVVDALLR
ncbi:PseG/SpsG family protein [Nonomuraea sp. NPDC004354]